MSENSRKKTIAVFGSSRRDQDSQLYREGYQLGRLLAGAGYRVLSGGYGGSMAAVSHGAAEAGGVVIGATCALFDPLPPNPWVAEEIKAPDLLDRLRVLVEQADGFVALRGGIGTLTEVALVWSLLQTRAIPPKPLVLLGSDWRKLVEAFHAYTDLGTSIATLAHIADTPDDALAALAVPPPPTPPGPPLG